MSGFVRGLPALFVLACGTSSLPPNANAPPLPGPVSAQTSSVEIDVAQVIADGQSAATVRATLRDANGRAASGAAVSFAPAAGVQFDPPIGSADAEGVFVARVKSVEVGRRDLVLQTRGDSLHAGIQFVPGPPDVLKSALTVPGVPIASDGLTPATITVVLKDALSHPIPGAHVEVEASGSGVVANPIGVTGADGVFSSALTSTVDEDDDVIVFVGTSAGSIGFFAHVAFARTAPSLAQSRIVATPASAFAGTPIALTVEVRDVAGSPIPAVPVSIAVKGIKTVVEPPAGTTQPDGTFSATLSSTFAETKKVTATVQVFDLHLDVLLTGLAWQRLDLGLAGGLPRSVAIDPSNPDVAIAPAEGSIFRSADGGRTWTAVAPSGGDGFCAVFDPAGADAYVCSGGPLVSHDHGATWAPMGASFPSAARGIAVAPGKVYVAFHSGGLYVSSDGGATLGPLATTPAQQLNGVAVDPSNPQRLYAWSDSGLFISGDAGAHWTEAVPGGSPGLRVSMLAVDPALPSRLFAVVQGFGLSTSTDSGASWSHLPLAFNDFAFLVSIALDPDSPAMFLGDSARLLRSPDRGATWTAISGSGFDLPSAGESIALDRVHPGVVLAAAIGSQSAGIYRSTDSGAHWSFSSAGMDEQAIDGLAADPFDADVALVSVFGLLRKTTDAGGTWTTSAAGLPPRQALQILADPTSRGTWFVQMLNDGIYKSDDGGASWRRSTPAALRVNPTGFSVVATSPATLFAAEPRRVFRSLDAGETWTELAAAPALDKLHACAAQPEVVFGASGDGIFRSGDGGTTWTQVHAGFGPANFVSAVQVDPADANTAVVAFTTIGLLQTVDGGRSWTDVTPPSGSPGVLDLAVSATDAATYFVESADSVWRTHDRGTTWEQAADGFGAHPRIEKLAISGADPLLVYAGTFAHGLWRTSTGGK
ncbi:MAG TPA: Ig-like domain-containing protein [Myxococcales bacterium]